MSVSVSAPSKLELAGEIGRLETELAQAEAELRKKEDRLKSARGNRVAGTIAILIGLVCAFFLGGLISWLGLLLVAAGLLAWVTAIFQQGNAKRAIQQQEQVIAAQRGQLAEKRAQLAIL